MTADSVLKPIRRRASTQLAGPLARWTDRFGMWMMMRDHYGTDYSIEPAQITQSNLEPYLGLCGEADRDRLFPKPKSPSRVELRRSPKLMDNDGPRPIWFPRSLEAEKSTVELERHDFEFPSAHRPLFPSFEEQFDSTRENHSIHGRLYKAVGTQPTRAILVIHGFAARDLDWVSRFTPAERMASRNVAVAVMTLPYHGHRTPTDALFSGELFLTGDIVRTFEGVLQAVNDVRTTAAWLRDGLGMEDVGLIAGSLGGYIATLTASVEPNLGMLYAVAPPIRITDSIDHVPLGRHMDAGLKQQNVPDEVLHQLQDLVDPSCHTPALPIDRMRFIAGRNDLFVPEMHMQRLVEHWKGLQVHWHNWGHITSFVAWPPKRLFDEIDGFASSLGF